MSPGRRAFLIGGGALALGGGLWAMLARTGAPRAGDLVDDPGAIVALGRAALGLDPGLTRERLEARLLGEPARPVTREALLARVRDDYASGRTREVHGWILSETELALVALVALEEGDE